MSTSPLSITEFAKSVRDKYPKVYDHLSDAELVQRVVNKYPQYKEHIASYAPTELEKKVSGEGISLKGAGGAALETLKKALPSAPDATMNPFSSDFWTAKNIFGSPSIDPSKSTLAQMGQEASTEYKRARAAGTNPLAAGYSAAISGAGPLVGISDIEQQRLAERGEGGQIIGQSAALAGQALLPEVLRKTGPMLRGERPSPVSVKGALSHVGENIYTPEGRIRGVKEIATRKLIKDPYEPARKLIKRQEAVQEERARLDKEQADIDKERQQRSAAHAEMESEFAKRERAAARTTAKEGQAVPVSQSPSAYRGPESVQRVSKVSTGPGPYTGPKSVSTTPPESETIYVDTGTGEMQPFSSVSKAMRTSPGQSTPPPRPEGSILSRGRMLYKLGEEPDMNNPVHVKIINQLQTRSGPELRTMAKNGDRFAAFILRNMPRPPL